MIKRFITTLFFLFILFFSAHTQEKYTYFQSITPQDGLSQGHVLSMIQDREGYVWIGTYYGLNRYNGYSFKLFSNAKENSTSLTNNIIYSLFEDRAGYIWVGTVYGLDRFDKKTQTFKHYRVNQGTNCLNNGYIHAITQDNQGNIWVATQFGGINRIDYKTDKITFIENRKNISTGLPSNTIYDLCFDSKNRLWIATDGNGLCYMNPVTRKIIPFPVTTSANNSNTIKKIYCLYKDSKDNIWLGDSEGKIFCTDVKNNRLIQHYYLPQEYLSKQLTISDIAEDSKGNILIGTDGSGLIIYNPNSKKSIINTHDINNTRSIASNEIKSLMVDRTGTVFAGTYGRGISKYAPSNNKFDVHNIRTNTSMTGEYNSFTDCVMDKSGHLIAGTYDGFVVFDTINWSYKQYYPGNNYADNKILSIEIAPDNTIWMGSNRSIHRYDANFNKINSYQLLDDRIDHPVYAMKFDAQNNLWVGLFVAEGLFKIPEKEWRNVSKKNLLFKIYKNKWGDSTSIGGDQIWSLSEDSHKKLWIGNNQSVSAYKPQNDNFSQLNFTSLAKTIEFDAMNNLWIATRGDGIFYYNPTNKKIKHYTNENGLIQNFVFGIINDKNKNLWLTTENGLSKFNPTTETFRNYDQDDGLPSNRFDDRSEKMLPDGRIYMGTSHGFILFRPEEILDDTSKTKVVLTNIKISNVALDYSFLQKEKNILTAPVDQITEIKLNPIERKDLVIEFAALHYSAPLKNKFKYMLEGFDKEWIQTDAFHRIARYTNLVEGTYYFMVKASNSDGIWNDKPYVLKIIVSPPFYKSQAFLISFILFFIVAISLFFRYKLNHELKLKKKLTLIVEERTAEITEKNQLLEKKSENLNHSYKLLQDRQMYIETQKEELAVQRDKLIQLNATKDKLFSIIAHDLKNPFNILMGFSNLLLENFDQYDDTRKKNIIAMLHHNAYTAHQLLDNLLHWSRSQSGNLGFDPTHTSAREIITNSLSLAANFAANKNIKINFHASDENPPLIADTNMINTVLRNLILNAIKFSKKNSSIDLDYIVDSDCVRFRVIDQGIGMNQSTIDNLFQLNKTISTEGTEGEKGTGLGLIICKDFIDKHKGRLWVESEEGKGSIFTFTLPLE